MRKILAGVALAALLMATGALAADDPSIKGQHRVDIKEAMMSHVAFNTVDGKYVIYDALEDDLLRLRFDGLHEGVVKKGDFYVACGDFMNTANDTYYDLDFLVSVVEGDYRVLQAVVHKKGDDEREYHVED